VELTERLISQGGPVVRAGPFQGLEMSPSTHKRHLGPKLLGTYEMELHPVWESVLTRAYRSAINVGCAEGYYAVGLARRWPSVPTLAFDIDPWARNTTREMARQNGVHNLTVKGCCNSKWLAHNLLPGSFILSDCEGYEDALFPGPSGGALAQCDMLIELHEREAPGVTQRLKDRFAPSHSATLVRSRPRAVQDVRDPGSVSARDLLAAINEYRNGEQAWLFLDRKARG
jgi:hypothetical protein